MRPLYLSMLTAIAITCIHAAPVSPTLSKANWKQLKAIKNHKKIPASQLPQIRDLLWKQYKAAESTKPDREAENSMSEMSFNGKTMKITKVKLGKRPKNGYPLYIALHGGGGGPARMNDGQYNHMKVYYRDSIKTGIYVAARGITNTWNLHFVKESYILYDRLIENALLYDDVDPNRVYVMGFSAGGDGVYQLGPRMADRWAAANMSAGHHNGVPPTNLMNVPFLFQVGEKDAAYKRNLVAVDFLTKLETLQKAHPNGYKHQLNIHYNRGHNFLDNHPKRPVQPVITNPHAWRTNKDRTTHKIDTNAVSWLSQHTRNPHPTNVMWDLNTTASRAATEIWENPSRGKRHYWLSIGDQEPKAAGKQILASFNAPQNMFTIDTDVTQLELMLSSEMIDFAKLPAVLINKQKVAIQASPKLATMITTLSERGDPSYIFEAVVRLKSQNGTWTAEQL